MKTCFLEPIETRSFHGFDSHKKDFFTRLCRLCYGEKMYKKSEKTKNLYWVGALKNSDFLEKIPEFG